MKTTLRSFFYFVLLVSANFSFAQSDSAEKKSHFKAGIFYISSLHYYGRTDSINSSGVFPLLEFWINKNVYVNTAPVFVHSSTSFKYAGTVTSAGYQFRKNKVAGHFYVVKPFYRSDARLVQSALKAQIAGNVILLNKILNVSMGTDVKFSDRADYGATAGLSHSFRKQLRTTVVSFVPSMDLYAGTQTLATSYIKKTGGSVLFPGSEELMQGTSQQFNLLSFELSAPLIVQAGKLQVFANPAYTIPRNILPGEQGRNIFSITLGSKYTW